jgi:pyruvate ferredoxin oxidoreductase delta subunit
MPKNKCFKEQKKVKFEIGALAAAPGSSVENKTGGWRALRPVWDKKKCTQCMLCWLYCPEPCIPQKDGKRQETDFDFCKGCGICASICPVKAISMVKEEK